MEGRVNTNTNTQESTMATEFTIEQEVIGKGSFSTVFRATHSPSQTRVAAKVIDVWKNKEIFDREVSTLKALDHQNIVECLHSKTQRDGKGIIFLEHIPHPTLSNHLLKNGALPLHHALPLFHQLVSAVEHMQRRNVAHLDLKPENLAYDARKNRVKVFDFGLSVIYAHSNAALCENFVGSPMYMSPEVLMRQKYNPFAADVWSLGVVLYEMLTGQTPFSSFTCLDELLDFVCFETSVPLPPSLPVDVQDILRKMLDFNPETRITIGSLRNMLAQHEQQLNA